MSSYKNGLAILRDICPKDEFAAYPDEGQFVPEWYNREIGFVKVLNSNEEEKKNRTFHRKCPEGEDKI